MIDNEVINCVVVICHWILFYALPTEAVSTISVLTISLQYRQYWQYRYRQYHYNIDNIDNITTVASPSRAAHLWHPHHDSIWPTHPWPVATGSQRLGWDPPVQRHKGLLVVAAGRLCAGLRVNDKCVQCVYCVYLYVCACTSIPL